MLNWNGADYLRSCLERLRSDICDHIEVVVVDNGSTDDSLSVVRAEAPIMRCVAFARNLGFSRAYNEAVLQVGGRILVFLNNDTLVEPGWLPRLVDPLIREMSIAVTTPKLLFAGTRMVNAVGGALKLWTGPIELGLGLNDKLLSAAGVVDPFFASGAAMAIRRDVFERLGGFDEGMFAFGEDVDLCWRARLAGYRIVCVPESTVEHHGSATWTVLNPIKLRMTTRHYIRAMVKNLSWLHLLHSLPAFFIFSLLKGAALAIVTRRLAYLSAALLAFVDCVRDAKDLRMRRKAAQNTRTVSDRLLLASGSAGLVQSLAETRRQLLLALKSLSSVRRTD